MYATGVVFPFCVVRYFEYRFAVGAFYPHSVGPFPCLSNCSESDEIPCGLKYGWVTVSVVSPFSAAVWAEKRAAPFGVCHHSNHAGTAASFGVIEGMSARVAFVFVLFLAVLPLPGVIPTALVLTGVVLLLLIAVCLSVVVLIYSIVCPLELFLQFIDYGSPAVGVR